ncbi:hypothetical protein UPYG_G00144380 [Umbra pygmaea]|uniref:Uncharacterized protein n=1 Tax=Umbra pygmaea TaxID=75934 RepID=A0ABD0XGN6_UMBPY
MFSAPAPPTASLAKQRDQHQLHVLQERLEWQKKKISELESERDFLRGQVSALTAKENNDNQVVKICASESDSEMTTSDLSTSTLSSSSSSPHRKRKQKSNKGHKRAKKQKDKKNVFNSARCSKLL